MTRSCIECSQPINPLSLSFEMRLVDIDFLCRRCYDLMLEEVDAEDIPHLQNPRFMVLSA